MNNQDYALLLKEALQEIRRLRMESEQKNLAENEPVAILSLACRFPGANTPEDLWKNVRGGVDSIQPIPADRWDRLAYFDPDPDTPGKMICTSGGFLNDVRHFDASFFGISPREAKYLDPQQRLLLELSWEALERATLVPENLFTSPVGVFLGLSNLEYATVIRQSGDLHAVNSYYGTGNAASVTAGRLAYYYGFQGPAFVVDTACSSSLVALHLAVASLRREECSLAIAGGVNLMLLPETFVHFSNGRMLSSDGRCKPFSASADGYGRSEGCGIVVLKRLRDAIRDSDPIVAVIRGSAINHDGRSAGLTAPNGPSQESVIQASLKDAGLKANDIQFVEAHGTGTPLGDPIEAGALARVYGHSRTKQDPLWVSTIKANIGHAESAAGIAGVIHAALCLQHGELPPLLHMKQRSSHVPWDSLQFATAVSRLPNTSEPIRCGVSSFGFSGTNGHLILEQYRDSLKTRDARQVPPVDGQKMARLFFLSAKTTASLRSLVARYIDWLDSFCTEEWENVCFTSHVGRTHFAKRIAVIASDQGEAVKLLREWLTDQANPNFVFDTDHSQSVNHRLHSNQSSELVPIAIAYAAGDTIHPNAIAYPSSARRICLPSYAFQGEAFWVGTSPNQTSGFAKPRSPQRTFEDTWNVVEEDAQRICEHQLFGASIMPGVGWIHFASTSALKHCIEQAEIRSLRFEKMYLLPSPTMFDVHVQMIGSLDEGFDFRIHPSTDSIPPSFDSPYASGRIQVSLTSDWHGGNLANHRANLGDATEVTGLYDQLESLGFGYGPSYRKLQRLWSQGATALGQLESAPSDESQGGLGERLGLFDSALHTIAGATISNQYLPQDATAFIPVSIDKLSWFDRKSEPAWCRTVLRNTSSDYCLEADVFMWSNQDQPVLQILGMRLEGFSIEKPTRVDESNPISSSPSSGSLLNYSSLLSISEPERSLKLQEHLREHLARELEIPPSSLRAEQPLAELGLDSLMIFRMGIQLESEFGFVMDTKVWMDGLNLQQLTMELIKTVEQRAQQEVEAKRK